MNVKKIIKVLPDSTGIKNNYTNGLLRIIGISNASDIDGDALMTSDCYYDIFKTKKKSARNSKKRLSIVKISANEQTIYRAYRGVSATNFLKNYVALTPNSIIMLNDKEGNEPQNAIVSEGSIFPFYWYHPDKAIRISAKLGFLSLLIGFVSFVAACISLYLSI